MPRWAAILLCLVLFAGAMLALRAGLHAALPPFNAWLDDTIGRVASFGLLAAIFGAVAAFVFWPRDAAGRMRALPLRRR